MPLRVNNNIPSLNTRRQLGINNRDLSTRIERLSSGLRINRAADDAAGLSISEGMRGELTGLKQAVKNAEQATNLIQTAEGSLNEINGILVRMRELSVQSASSTVTDTNRISINAEFTQLTNEIDRISSVTSYNNTTLLKGFGNVVEKDDTISTSLASDTTGLTDVQISGAAAGTYTFEDTDATDGLVTLGNGTVSQTINLNTALDGASVATGTTIVANFDRLGTKLTLTGNRALTATQPASDGFTDGDLDATALVINNTGTGGSFQIGPRDGAVHRIDINISDMSASGTVLNMGSLSTATQSGAQSAIATIDAAITTVANQRGSLGAFQNRLSFNMRSNESTIENLQASESAIRDADVATEVSAFTRDQILVQAGTALLAQANVLPQSALSLLG
ncbi:MAG: flagellin [Candidatus Latescibacteria bacterium]|nr:flagellin [Candidatus Latescibacterota bacterium]